MSSGFISETKIAELRKQRQEEWEKVRTADQPLEAPEEVYDPRCLYERLQEQKHKRDAEYEEAHKLKNMIKGLDDDEVDFLELVDRTKMEEERKKNLEEEKEIKEFKAKVASLQEKSLDERLKLELKQPQISNKSTTSKHSQLRLLAGAVKKPVKTGNVESPIHGVKRKLSETDSSSTEKIPERTEKRETNSVELSVPTENTEIQSGALKCVAILPGLGSYENSSDSCSSDSEQESPCKQKKVDLLGREILIPVKEKETN